MGRMDLDVQRIKSELRSPTPNDIVIANSIKNCMKIINTIASKKSITRTTAIFSDIELTSMKIRN